MYLSSLNGPVPIAVLLRSSIVSLSMMYSVSRMSKAAVVTVSNLSTTVYLSGVSTCLTSR
jgi:hypothetical protein